MMAYNMLLLFFAKLIDHALTQQLEFVLAKSKILKSRIPHQISTTPAKWEKLIELGKPLGDKVKKLGFLTRICVLKG